MTEHVYYKDRRHVEGTWFIVLQEGGSSAVCSGSSLLFKEYPRVHYLRSAVASVRDDVSYGCPMEFML